MKKLLSMIGVISIVGSGASAVLACDNNSIQESEIILTNEQKADAIAKTITKLDINVPYTTNPIISNPATQAAITKALEAANSGLVAAITKYDATITYTGSKLIPETAVDVTATITVGTGSGEGTANKVLKVALKKVPPQRSILSGYWYAWTPSGGAKSIDIGAINPAYNLIDVAFYAKQGGKGLPVLGPGLISEKTAIVAGIKKQHVEGHKVVLSIGGQNDETEITSSEIKTFESYTEKIIKDYGFDGIDIDLEGGPASDQDNATNVPIALKAIKVKEGSDFLITMAPEFPKLRAGASIYTDLITNLGSDLNYVQPQLYNQYGDGINVSTADQTKFGVPSYLAENNTSFHAQFLYLMMKYLAAPAGEKGGNAFPVIPVAKLLIGLPATTKAAGEGYTTPAVVKKAYDYFVANSLDISGLMTWAVNYDYGNSDIWQFANKTYKTTWGS